MSTTPLGGFPSIGVESSWASEMGLLFVSVIVTSGAFWPTRGAPGAAGIHLAATKKIKRNSAQTRTPTEVTIEATIFERSGLSVLNARRKPATKRARAPTNKSRLAHGKLRVVGYQTKIK